MKKLTLLLFLILSFSCNSDDSEEIIEECLSNIDLVGSWYWGDQVIVFTEDTFAYYSNDETYFNNPSSRIYCIQGDVLYVPEFIATDFYFEIVDGNSFLFGYASSPNLFVRGEDYQEWQPVCMAIDRLQNILGSTGRDIFARERHLAVVQDVTQGGAVDQHLERSVSSARDEPDAAVGDVGDDTLTADDVGHARVFRHLDDASV